jgi:hypothetical protein
MSYGPGYTMWKQILREREERRLARQQAKRTITPPQEPEAPARKRSKNPAKTAPGSTPPASRSARRPSAAHGAAASAEQAGRRAARSAAQ